MTTFNRAVEPSAGDDNAGARFEIDLDDRELEAMLGAVANDRYLELTSFVVATRSIVELLPPPVPSDALSAVFAGSMQCVESAQRAPDVRARSRASRSTVGDHGGRTPSRVREFIAGLSVGAKIVLGTGVAFGATAGADIAGVLPKPIARIVDAVNPFGVEVPPHRSVAPAAAPAPLRPRRSTHPDPSTIGTTLLTTPPANPASGAGIATKPAGRGATISTVGPRSSEVPTVPGVGVAPTTTPAAPSTPAVPSTSSAAPTTTTTATSEIGSLPIVVTLDCSASGSEVQCAWTPTQTMVGATYTLVRVGPAPTTNRVLVLQGAAQGTFTDTFGAAGSVYHYGVYVRDAAGHGVGRSNYLALTYP